MKISIILPTYNRAELFLSRAINSVVNQTYENWELIIIDNNSIDNTKQLVSSYQDNKIKLIDTIFKKGKREVLLANGLIELDKLDTLNFKTKLNSMKIK